MSCTYISSSFWITIVCLSVCASPAYKCEHLLRSRLFPVHKPWFLYVICLLCTRCWVLNQHVLSQTVVWISMNSFLVVSMLPRLFYQCCYCTSFVLCTACSSEILRAHAFLYRESSIIILWFDLYINCVLRFLAKNLTFFCALPSYSCSLNSRRQEGNPLDLNNLPEEYGKQAVESSTTTATSSAHAVRKYYSTNFLFFDSKVN